MGIAGKKRTNRQKGLHLGRQGHVAVRARGPSSLLGGEVLLSPTGLICRPKGGPRLWVAVVWRGGLQAGTLWEQRQSWAVPCAEQLRLDGNLWAGGLGSERTVKTARVAPMPNIPHAAPPSLRPGIEVL